MSVKIIFKLKLLSFVYLISIFMSEESKARIY